MKKHKNSQKRFYQPGRTYFITTNTHDRFPYFDEAIFCEILIEDLEFCSIIKEFEIMAYKINPDHVHMLIWPKGKENYSNIMGSLKRNFARDYNDILLNKDLIRKPDLHNFADSHKGDYSHKGDDSNRRLYENRCIYEDNAFIQHIENLGNLKLRFNGKFGNNPPFPRFKWQKSFHFHMIEDSQDLKNHLRYIADQWQKHCLPENKYCFMGDMDEHAPTGMLPPSMNTSIKNNL